MTLVNLQEVWANDWEAGENKGALIRTEDESTRLVLVEAKLQ
jgi:hypothetical protein